MAKPDVCGRTSADGETSSWGLQPQSEKYSPSRDTQEIHSLGLFAVITSQSWLLIAVLIICVESSNLSPSLLPVELCKTATFLSWTSCCKISAISVTSCDYNAFQKTQQTLQCHTQTQQPMEGRNRLRNGRQVSRPDDLHLSLNSMCLHPAVHRTTSVSVSAAVGMWWSLFAFLGIKKGNAYTLTHVYAHSRSAQPREADRWESQNVALFGWKPTWCVLLKKLIS